MEIKPISKNHDPSFINVPLKKYTHRNINQINSTYIIAKENY